MKVLLVLHNGQTRDCRILVRLHSKDMIKRLHDHMTRSQQKQAFDLCVAEAEVQRYLPPGQESTLRPDLILIEDLL